MGLHRVKSKIVNSDHYICEIKDVASELIVLLFLPEQGLIHQSGDHLLIATSSR